MDVSANISEKYQSLAKIPRGFPGNVFADDGCASQIEYQAALTKPLGGTQIKTLRSNDFIMVSVIL